MDSFSILIGGKAGFGIDSACSMIARLFNNLGYHFYIYREYPSLIRGGHTFSLIRISSQKILAHEDSIDILLALNQESVELHKKRLKPKGLILYDSDSVKSEGISIPIKKFLWVSFTKRPRPPSKSFFFPRKKSLIVKKKSKKHL